MDIQSLCNDQYTRYPLLETQDLVKALYQREFGCGHLIADPDCGLAWLKEELLSCQAPDGGQPPLVEPLGDMFCRVHLQAAKSSGLSAGTLFRLFALSAEKNTGSMEAFEHQLTALYTMITSGKLPLPPHQAQQFLSEYRHAGCPATHHSAAFRRAYRPAYRVIRADYARFLALFAAIDNLLAQGRPVCVAIEGSSATGKSSLAALLKRVYDCNVFHMDDFFLQPHQRTPARFDEPGGNIDYERFREEVLLPLSAGKPFSYRPFSCATMSLASAVQVEPRQLSIIHPSGLPISNIQYTSPAAPAQEQKTPPRIFIELLPIC